jgi:hypothetical protein
VRGPEIRQTHPYQADPTVADYAGRRPCTCGFPKGWRGHADAPETSPEAAAIDARILGETEERTEGENPS